MPRLRRSVIIVLVALGALVIVTRIVLDPIAAHFTKRSLEKLDGYRATFKDVHVSILPPRYEITRFKVIEEPERGGRWREPIVYADRARISVHWRKLLHGDLVANARLIAPKVVVARQHERKAKKELPALADQLESLAPLRVDRFEIAGGELLFAESPREDAPRIWLHDLDVVAENLATREEIMEGEPATLEAHATLQKTGKLSASVRANPWTPRPTFSGRAALRELALRDLYAFFEEKSDLQATAGTVDVFADFRARNGRLEGGVKPLLKNVEVRAADGGLGNKIKAWLVDEAFELAADRVPGRHAVATVIPIRGTVRDPEAQLAPTILGVIRNAFVVGLESGFANLPPPEAEKKEGIIKQAVEALKKSEGPPKAQPTGEKAQGRRSQRRR